MEPYFKEYIFIENMVAPPKILNTNLFENLRLILSEKYPKTYLDKGYIFNLKILKILDNIITLCGQIILTVKVRADLYTPKINHVFEGEIKSSSVNKYQWIEIGPLIIYLDSKTVKESLINKTVKVKIISIKTDNTLCFGKIIV